MIKEPLISSFEIKSAIFVALLGLCALGIQAKRAMVAHDEKINDEWRAAAGPIFKARNVPSMIHHATPRDLANALDARLALTPDGALELDPSLQKPSLMTVVRVDLVDRDPDRNARFMGHCPW